MHRGSIVGRICFNQQFLLNYTQSEYRGIVMSSDKYNIHKIMPSLNTFSPFDLSEVDGEYLVRIARFRGTFPFHTHPKDEFFLTLEGSFALETRGSKIILNQGECTTMRAGLEHRPTGEKDAIVLTVLHKTIRTSKHDFPEIKDKL